MFGIWWLNSPTGSINYSDRFQVLIGMSPSFTSGVDVDVSINTLTLLSSLLVPIVYLPGRIVRVRMKLEENIRQRISLKED